MALIVIDFHSLVVRPNRYIFL